MHKKNTSQSKTELRKTALRTLRRRVQLRGRATEEEKREIVVLQTRIDTPPLLTTVVLTVL